MDFRIEKCIVFLKQNALGRRQGDDQQVVICIQNDDFVFKMMVFVFKMMVFVFKMMGFVFKMMVFVFKMMTFVFKMMIFVFKMMNSTQTHTFTEMAHGDSWGHAEPPDERAI